MQDLVLIMNFDKSASRAIAKGLRAEHICCRIVPPDITAEEIAAEAPLGLILSGGTSGSAPAKPAFDLTQCTVPVLALGDAAFLLGRFLGVEVQQTVLSDAIGHVHYIRSPLTGKLEDCDRMLPAVRHLKLPEGIIPIAECSGEAVGFADTARSFYGMQFTMEQNDTDGILLLLAFAEGICGCTHWWDQAAFTEGSAESIRAMVGSGRAICSMTGGLDSGVSALLAHRALGEKLQCIFIDTGLMRDGEGSRFMSFYRDRMGLNICHVHAEERFLNALHGISDPAVKRKVIGDTLQSVIDETLARMGEFSAVIRGTICSEVMSGADKNKLPHIFPDLPRVEPLRELFKGEVRQIGAYLGMPPEVVDKQTFPGSGLALRILGEVTPAKLQTIRAADAIFTDELTAAGQLKRVWQHFCLLSDLPGNDTHSMVILRAVTAGDGTIPGYACRLPADLQERITQRILHDRPEVQHVVYDLSPGDDIRHAEWQ